jgi:hypothetical protein
MQNVVEHQVEPNVEELCTPPKKSLKIARKNHA